MPPAQGEGAATVLKVTLDRRPSSVSDVAAGGQCLIDNVNGHVAYAGAEDIRYALVVIGDDAAQSLFGSLSPFPAWRNGLHR